MDTTEQFWRNSLESTIRATVRCAQLRGHLESGEDARNAAVDVILDRVRVLGGLSTYSHPEIFSEDYVYEAFYYVVSSPTARPYRDDQIHCTDPDALVRDVMQALLQLHERRKDVP